VARHRRFRRRGRGRWFGDAGCAPADIGDELDEDDEGGEQQEEEPEESEAEAVNHFALSMVAVSMDMIDGLGGGGQTKSADRDLR